MVYRIYVEKKPGQRIEADALTGDLKTFLRLDGLKQVRVLNRYDVQHIDKALFDACKTTVFSEPQLDDVYETPDMDGAYAFAVEYLPGQFDQRADSASQCIQILSQSERPTVRTAKLYLIYGTLSQQELAAVKKYLINPVESREASLEPVSTLEIPYQVPTQVDVLDQFLDLDEHGLEEMLAHYGLAMDLDDLKFCQAYFKQENRCPTITEIRMIDTYWSDHCRHTTFLTTIDSVHFEDALLQNAYEEYQKTRQAIGRTKPVTLMDIGTIAAKYLRQTGQLDKLDESEEINACTVRITVQTENGPEPWLLLFKNETHNHPTEIEPFGGAATCIGGAIRDPLSGRSYVYAAMRVTGAGNPLRPIRETIAGKLPQRKLVTTAAAGYSSYGNQIGLATGQVDEWYHDGYVAKRMEIGAVIAAAPEKNVRREQPIPGDQIILLGGRTGRDGCGGATGSSKSHTLESLETCGAEVQKGNAPEERKLQRLLRNPEASLLIKRCNDFGAGGVSVAIGELADGLEIDLNAVPKKYEGLDGTELAISESQERMAVVVAREDAARFCQLADGENLEATVVAQVTREPRLAMRWNGQTIVDISREFLNSNGAPKHIDIAPEKPRAFGKEIPEDFQKGMLALADDLNVCSRRGLSERFDSTIGAGTVLMPFGGKYQRTPIQAMVHKISLEQGDTSTCSFMSWGFNPYISEKSPYHGAYLAVVESAARLVATGASFRDVYLTFQEYFEKPQRDPKRWGKPLAALLGAFMAQKELGIAAIGGKDSMSGTFEQIDVPPTLVSFAVTTGQTDQVVSPELKKAGHHLLLLTPEYDENGLPKAKSLKALFDQVTALMRQGHVFAAWTPGFGGAAEGLMKMAFGNRIGVEFDKDVSLSALFGYAYGGFVLETDLPVEGACLLGRTTDQEALIYGENAVDLQTLLHVYEQKLEPVYSCNITQSAGQIPELNFVAGHPAAPAVLKHHPRVLIPVFPGTNCEYDSAKAVRAAGGEAEIFVINNLSAAKITQSIDAFAQKLKQSQMIFIPGGFSGGDEPDGSAKFITAFFRNAKLRDGVHELLKNRDGLICGICNGFQALVKLGLVPFGEIIETDDTCPTLSFNTIGRHQSMLVRTRIASNKSPWLAKTRVGDIYTVAISHGEGRFVIDEKLAAKLAQNGQIATQYVDLTGKPTSQVAFNPNNSVWAIEGITSPDGRVFGKMGHSERVGRGLYRNVEGCYDIGMFESAVNYFNL